MHFPSRFVPNLKMVPRSDYCWTFNLCILQKPTRNNKPALIIKPDMLGCCKKESSKITSSPVGNRPIQLVFRLFLPSFGIKPKNAFFETKGQNDFIRRQVFTDFFW